MKNNEEYITLTSDTGEEERVRLIAKVNFENKGDFMLYQKNGEMYGAKCEENGELTRLSFNLTDEEKYLLNEFAEGLEVK